MEVLFGGDWVDVIGLSCVLYLLFELLGVVLGKLRSGVVSASPHLLNLPIPTGLIGLSGGLIIFTLRSGCSSAEGIAVDG